MKQPVVIGKIELPEIVNSKCICDECKCELNDSLGDPRNEVFVMDENYKPLGYKMVCDNCLYEY